MNQKIAIKTSDNPMTDIFYHGCYCDNRDGVCVDDFLNEPEMGMECMNFKEGYGDNEAT